MIPGCHDLLWHCNRVTEREDSTQSAATRTVPRPDPDFDVLAARRVAASFGGGEPTIADVIREFVRRYGWRAYALPVLVVVTVVALATAGSKGPAARSGTTPVADQRSSAQTDPPPPSAPPPSASPSILPTPEQPGTGAPDKVPARGALPVGPAYTTTGTGTFRVVPGTSKVVGKSLDGHGVWRYDVEIENGITGVDVARFAAMVQTTLADPRSWSGHGVALQRVDSGAVDFRVSLTSAMLVRQYCGYEVKVETSCYARAFSVAGLDVNRVVLNVARWVRGSEQYRGDLHAYRLYMINHEDGHAIGHGHAHQCLPGGLAPVMMQQSVGLTSASTRQKCGANPWPYPPGAKGAPGAEQVDSDANSELNLP